MDSPDDKVLGDFMIENETTMMDIERSDVAEAGEEDDPFLKFIDYAKSILYENAGESEKEDPTRCPSWSWIATRILKTCVAYSSGVTPAILLSELSLAWNEQNRSGAPKKQSDFIAKLKKKHKRAKLTNTITIDSIYEKKFLPLSSVIEAVVVDAFVLPGTDICMLTLGDIWSSNTIDLYLHRRFYNIADPRTGVLKKGREVLLTGCYLRVSSGSTGCARLLPTEYFVALLDEDEDYDAMLLGAQFCSDSFSSISLDSVNEGASYSLYARIEHIGPLEIQGKYGSLRRRQITLVDNDGVRLEFLLWGEQVLIANLFSTGSMLALDKPFISSATDSSLETCSEICMEYGSATQLYLVPIIPHKEQVCVALTQNHYQGSRLLISNPSEGPLVSQVTLPCDSHGSIDFSNYPFRSYVVDLRDKMMGISIYGIVTDIRASKGIFSLRIEDATGAIWAKLHFVKSWSLGRLGIGHTVYISGLSSSLSSVKSLELSWYENSGGSSFFNLSCLPAFLNTQCLHRLLCLSNLSIHTRGVQVCRVWLDQIEHCHVDTRSMHAICGHLVNKAPNGEVECEFCGRICEAEVECMFHLKITVADETGKVFASCVGQTAAELLQISPHEFAELPEEEQIMYPSSLEQEKFVVAIVNCRRKESCGGFMVQDQSTVDWEVTRAIKCE
ncbi:Nucleic acid-binding proteins superfamily [Perilla frutescens var. hirtella]|uniref:Nucleic acid-binding proteins superfamily n=1 Tax=Perilla frutescens var. hirtella TaxID=608512 RepID=A0AAD4JDJ7_PERFH|nr:Nucleic acid-binding proteins superfamily [Perilla frutescens var. hirtella]